jgi:hypothetical protein
MYCLFTYHFFCITSEISYNLLSTFHHIQNVIYVLLDFDCVAKDVHVFMPFVLENAHLYQCIMQALRSRHVSAGIEASRISYPPVEPLVLVLWLNQVTRRFCVELPPTPRADSCREPLPCTDSGRRLRLAFLATMRRTLDPVRLQGPSSRAYLALHSWEAPQGSDLSRLLFTCTNTNQAAICTCNTRPRVSPETNQISANGNSTLCTCVIVPGSGYHVQSVTQVVHIHTTRE